MMPWLGPPPALQAPAPPERLPSSVVKVRSARGRFFGTQGSGVVVAPGVVATNAHVVRGHLGITVWQGEVSWTVTRVVEDSARDLALLWVPGLTLPTVRFAEAPPKPGAPIWVVGYPGGHGPTVSPGRLRGIWYLGPARLLQSDAPTAPGSSGGALLDDAGCLLGLTTLTFTSSPRMSFALPAAWVRDLVDHPDQGLEGPSAWRLDDRTADLLERLAQDPRNWPAWETAARQWVADRPDDPQAWLALGLALDRAARVASDAGSAGLERLLPEGVEAYHRALALHPDAKTYNNLGVALDLLNRFPEAETAFSKALELDPNHALAWFNLGSARLNAGAYRQAAEAFRAGLRLHPDEANAWIRLGHAQRLAGDRSAAVTSLEVATRYRPLSSELWLDLGLLLADLGRGGEAEAVRARLEVLSPAAAAVLKNRLPRPRRTSPHH